MQLQKNGKYHFEEISITNRTQGDANYLMGVRGYTYFERLLRESQNQATKKLESVWHNKKKWALETKA